MAVEISIIIVNYNTLKLTSQCIQSIVEKTSHLDYEIILVDNASTECNPEIFLEKFPQIKLIKSDTNAGFAKGNNLGLEFAKGEFLLFLNSDTELTDNSIYIAYQRIKKDPQIGVLSSKLIYPDGRMQYVSGRFPSLKTELKELFRLTKYASAMEWSELYLGDRFDHLTEKEVDWVWGAFFMTKRSIIDQLPNKKLHDDFFMYQEDVQWCYAIKNLRYKIIYYPEAVVIHHLSGSAAVADQNKIIKFQTKILPNEFKFLRKEKGILYVALFYFVKSLFLISLRKKKDIDAGKFLLRFLSKNLIFRAGND